MSLDNIQLPGFLVQELYKDSLVNLNSEQLITNPLQKGDLRFLGNNELKIVLVVDEPDFAFLPDDDLNFLVGILNACKLSLKDIALLNFHKSPEYNYPELLARFSPGKLLLFGVDPNTLGIPLQFPHYQLQQYDGKTFLSAPALKMLAADKEMKKLLWTSLKNLFKL